MFAGLSLLLVPVLCQNLSEISVNEEANLALLDFLQNNSLGIMLKKNTQEKKQQLKERIMQMDLMFVDDSYLPAEIEESTAQQSEFVPKKISNYSEFIDNQNTQFFLNQSRQNARGVDFEVPLTSLGQYECWEGLQKFVRTDFQAIGTIISRMQNGSEHICLGTLLSSEWVITVSECFKEDAVEYFYQPIWSPSWRTRIVDHYIPLSQNEPAQNFVLFYLEEPLLNAPRMDIQIALPQDQKCHLTVLGWEEERFLNKDNFKMVMCPNLPQFQEQMGAISENCKADDLCTLENFRFVPGAAVILTCPQPLQNTLIGMLKFEVEISGGQFFLQEKYTVPFMFQQQTVRDIQNAVKRKK